MNKMIRMYSLNGLLRSISDQGTYSFELTLPEYHRIVHYGADSTGSPAMWIEFSSGDREVTRRFYAIGDDEGTVPRHYSYLGTIVTYTVTWHIYQNPQAQYIKSAQ